MIALSYFYLAPVHENFIVYIPTRGNRIGNKNILEFLVIEYTRNVFNRITRTTNKLNLLEAEKIFNSRELKNRNQNLIHF